MNRDPQEPAQTRQFFAWLAVAFGLTAFGAAGAEAQDTEAPPSVAAECPAGADYEACFRVAGRTHRPRAFYVLPRSLPRRDDPALRRSFVREIAASTRRGAL